MVGEGVSGAGEGADGGGGEARAQGAAPQEKVRRDLHDGWWVVFMRRKWCTRAGKEDVFAVAPPAPSCHTIRHTYLPRLLLSPTRRTVIRGATAGKAKRRRPRTTSYLAGFVVLHFCGLKLSTNIVSPCAMISAHVYWDFDKGADAYGAGAERRSLNALACP